MNKKKQTIPLIEYDRPTRREIGKLGEFAVRYLSQGKFIPQSEHRGDIETLNGATIEVKTSLVNKDGTYRFRLTKNDCYGVTDHSNSKYVVLVALDAMHFFTLYLIPCTDLKERKAISLGAHSKKYAKYRLPLSSSGAILSALS